MDNGLLRTVAVLRADTAINHNGKLIVTGSITRHCNSRSEAISHLNELHRNGIEIAKWTIESEVVQVENEDMN